MKIATRIILRCVDQNNMKIYISEKTKRGQLHFNSVPWGRAEQQYSMDVTSYEMTKAYDKYSKCKV